MDKLLRGVLRFNSVVRKDYLSHIQRVKEQKVKPLTVFIGCMDCRLQPSIQLQAPPGEIFIVRNPGNMVPRFDSVRPERVNSAAGGLELGCMLNGIGNVVVCGHSDCKAVNTLYTMRHCCNAPKEGITDITSHLKGWLREHGFSTLTNFTKLFSEELQQQASQGKAKLDGFKMNFGQEDFSCVLDPEHKFCIEDKLSQFNTLQQASHVCSYPILQPSISNGEIKVHAMWFDIHDGQMYLFSPAKKCFTPVEESSVDDLMMEVKS